MKTDNELKAITLSSEEIHQKISEMAAADDIDGLIELQQKVTGLYINLMSGAEEGAIGNLELPPLPDALANNQGKEV